VKLSGWAVETRLYAEDPFRGFLPSIGRLVRFRPPEQGKRGEASVRIDTGVEEGGEISLFYDPMIAKLVTRAPTRAAAIDGQAEALDAFAIEGIEHNIPFLAALMQHPRWRAGKLSTGFIAEEYPNGFHPVAPTGEVARTLAGVAAAIDHVLGERKRKISGQLTGRLVTRERDRFVVFRDGFGDDPVAVVVGTPDLSKPVPVRIHSACLTGDVFGSRRCDCGDQLKLALARLEAEGGGIILYLAQEGRGLGLANKMRTYQMQDDGLDTVDANTTLGFDDDERDYGIAARMLQMLNCTRIVLLTNNPAKLEGLAKAGIDIVSRMPLEAPINADNRRYLTAKAARAGHRLDHLMVSLTEPSEPAQGVAPVAT
jgi:GTP cyclohydrolase II